jgi:hypothetical protein
MRTPVNHMAATAALLALLGASALGLMGCSKNAPENIASAPPVIPPPPPTPVAEEPKEKPVYVYSGDRFRDPFVPAGTTGSYQPDAVFDPSKATVRGIIYGPGSKSAVLSAAGGGTYFVKAGKIFDIMGKGVEGFTAKVFADKVVILGEADNVFELKIRDEEEKSL